MELRILLTLTFITLTQGCPYALGNWEKQTPEFRASKAPIVVVGYVTKSYKQQAQKLNQTTYAIEFKILRTLKGADLIDTLPPTDRTSENIHLITNFGSMLMCFADVDEEHVFMLFLDVVTDHLSAKYTDLFGAAEVWTMSMEDKVILENNGKSNLTH